MHSNLGKALTGTLALVIGLNVLDASLTWIGISTGIQEQSPGSVQTMAVWSLNGWFAGKVAFSAIGAAIILLWRREDDLTRSPAFRMLESVVVGALVLLTIDYVFIILNKVTLLL